jgi:hypothetical protein
MFAGWFFRFSVKIYPVLGWFDLVRPGTLESEIHRYCE